MFDLAGQMLSNQNDSFTSLNANIRNIGKKIDNLKVCLKTLDHKFTAVGLSETHLKDKPIEYYHLPGYNLYEQSWARKGWRRVFCIK